MIAPGSLPYPPIKDYALIGDSRACALVSRDGSIDWMCLPRFDSGSIFGRLLDWWRGGHFQIAPEIPYETSRRYIEDTNVLETTFRTAAGEVTLTDFMPALTEDAKSRALQPLRALARIVEARDGRVPMRLEFVPRPDYGEGHVDLRAGSRFTVTASRGRNVTSLRSDVALDVTRFDARARFEAAPGARLRFAIAYSFAEPAVLISDQYVDQAFNQTVAYWKSWMAQCRYEGPYQAEVHRGALALKLLSYAPSGAIIAAPTTSLPEQVGGTRNWDYRFCWLRDAAFTVRAMLSIGLEEEAEAFNSWLLHATKLTAPRLDPMYSVYGERRIREREVPHLEGYRYSQPVRVGNAAADQHQTDVYGELIDAVYSFYAFKPSRKISHDEASFITSVANLISTIWREPDDGIWEARVERRQYTHSKVMAWVALDRAIKLAEAGSIKGDVPRWREEADVICDTVLHDGYNPEIGSFTQTLNGQNLDAAVLALPLVGFIAPDDPRMLSTLDAICRGLDQKGFLRRYESFDDGLRGQEGSFLVCNLWLAAAFARAGELGKARSVFETTMRAANDVGLLPEEYDPAADMALGNFPQGLSHLALIVAALEIQAAEQRLSKASSQRPSPVVAPKT